MDSIGGAMEETQTHTHTNTHTHSHTHTHTHTLSHNLTTTPSVWNVRHAAITLTTEHNLYIYGSFQHKC